MRFWSQCFRTLTLAMIITMLAIVMLPSPQAAAQQASSGLWTAEYYGNMELQGPIIFSESLPGPYLQREWLWGLGPQNGVPDDQWSARFSTRYTFPGGNVKFMLRSDDGSRMYLNGLLILDGWTDRPATWYEARVLPIPAGVYTITVEYYDHFGANEIEARFEPTTDEPSAQDQHFVPPGAGQGGAGVPGGVPGGGAGVPGGGGIPSLPPSGGIVVDDGDLGFTWAGFDEWGFGFGGLLNNLYLFTGNSEFAMRMWGRWNPTLPQTGNYDVYVWIPAHSNGTTNARYRVFHAGILSPVISVDQSRTGGSWVLLGTFNFYAGISHYVYLNDLTFEPSNSRMVLYDAVKFVYSANN